MFSCEFCEVSKNTFFIEHLVTASVIGESYWIHSKKAVMVPFLEPSLVTLLKKTDVLLLSNSEHFLTTASG